MQSLHQLLDQYGESHQNRVNKFIHWICVPSIMFSLTGMVLAIPFPFVAVKTFWINWAFVLFVLAWIYYLRLSFLMFVCFLGIGLLMMWGNFEIRKQVQSDTTLALISCFIFAIAWIGQFIGHSIEGKKPSFVQDLQFLLIGPAWLLHFVFKKLSIRY